MFSKRWSLGFITLTATLAACAESYDTADARPDAVDAAHDARRVDGDDTLADAVLDVIATDSGPCDAGEALCGSTCMNVQNDVHHCGACDTDCTTLAGVIPSAVRCIAGVCDATNACVVGRAHCTETPNAGCETDITTIDHCGSCDVRCAAGQPVCAPAAGGRVCSTGCPAVAPDRCGSTCTDTDTDPNNCGACGTSCNAGPHTTSSCMAGTCDRQCQAGYANCDGDWSNGCEAALTDDEQNCGACGRACSSGANGAAVCIGGTCDVLCSAGFANCNGSTADGCESASATDLSNCGQCGRRCNAPLNGAASCTNGTCDVVCLPGYVRCGDQCVSPDDPAFGCGSCAPCATPSHAASLQCTTSGCGIARCDSAYKVCGYTCAAINNPATGCGGASCAPCAVAPHATAMTCSSTGTCAPSACAAGYKLCGASCVAIAPSNGCAANGCGTACAVRNATAVCNASGACDYSTCSPGWVDLDGNRANGCETIGPAAIPGLRVWLDASNAASVHTVTCPRGRCVNRWDNLADAANPAVNTNLNNIPMSVWGGLLFNATVSSNGDGLYNPSSDVRDELPLNLTFMVGRAYTVFVKASTVGGGVNYWLGCQNGGIFANNSAFHLGFAGDTTLRQGQYNNDLNASVWQSQRAALVSAEFDLAQQSLTSEDLVMYPGAVSNFSRMTNAPLTAANTCALGRGPDGPQLRGLIWEVVIYDRALSAIERGQVLAFMRQH